MTSCAFTRFLSTSPKEPVTITTTESAQARDEAQLRQLIADQMNAICAKDLDRLMNHYAADVVVFDAKPPFQTKGADAVRRTWEACLPYFPDSFQTEMRDLSLTVSGDLALAHWLWRFTGMEKDHPAMQTWMRSTAGYRRPRVEWRKAFNRISAKHVDFRLCERNDLSIGCASECDDRSHRPSDRQTRDECLRCVGHAASLPWLQFPAQATYAVAAVQAQIMEAIGTRGKPSWDHHEQHVVATNAAEFREPSQCPTCSSPMMLRTARRRPHPGNQFWGGIRYPTCRGTSDIDA
jgi:ketosteroid isomerase-like protein